MSNRIFILVFTLLGFGSNAQEIGDTVPNYTFSDVLNGEPFSITDVRGKKPLIIEFWATWCVPCIPAMEHLEKLQAQFKGKLEIITVSSDTRDRLLKYLDATDSKLKIAYDTSHRAIFSYNSVPHTILIDAQGVIRAITRPNHVTPQSIEELIAGNPINSANTRGADSVYSTDTLYRLEDERKKVLVTNFQDGKSTQAKFVLTETGEVSKLVIQNMRMVSIYRELTKTLSSARIVFLDGLDYEDFPFEPENLLCIEIEYLTDEIDEVNMEVFRFLNTVQSIKGKKARRKIDQYELTQTQKILVNSMDEIPMLTYGGPYYSSVNQPLDKLAYYLENIAETPVLDRTGLSGTYDIELLWQIEAPETCNLELAKYGLHIKKVKKWKRKRIEVLEIYREY